MLPLFVIASCSICSAQNTPTNCTDFTDFRSFARKYLQSLHLADARRFPILLNMSPRHTVFLSLALSVFCTKTLSLSLSRLSLTEEDARVVLMLLLTAFAQLTFLGQTVALNEKRGPGVWSHVSWTQDAVLSSRDAEQVLYSGRAHLKTSTVPRGREDTSSFKMTSEHSRGAKRQAALMDGPRWETAPKLHCEKRLCDVVAPRGLCTLDQFGSHHLPSVPWVQVMVAH